MNWDWVNEWLVDWKFIDGNIFGFDYSKQYFPMHINGKYHYVKSQTATMLLLISLTVGPLDQISTKLTQMEQKQNFS